MSTHSHNTGYRILVIDDNPDIHEDFRKILCRERRSVSELDAAEATLFGETTVLGKQSVFEVDSAFQAEEGLARVYHALQEERPYAMAFVDVRMPPGLDGIEITPRLWIADPELQIVICTAYSDYTWEEMFAKTGVSDRMFILRKPFERDEILQLAHSLTEKRRLLQQDKLKPATRTEGLEAVGDKLETVISNLKRHSKHNP